MSRCITLLTIGGKPDPFDHRRQAGGAEPPAINPIRTNRGWEASLISARPAASIRRCCLKASVNIANFYPPQATNDL
jgi:hypothetical protein